MPLGQTIQRPSRFSWQLKSDNIGILQEVHEKSINLNAYGTCKLWTPLHVACFYGSLKVVKFLLSKRVVFNSMDKDGKTPLNLAEENVLKNF